MDKEEINKFSYTALMAAVCVLLANFYWFLHPWWETLGLSFSLLDDLYLRMVSGGAFRTPLLSKMMVFLLAGAALVLKPASNVKERKKVFIIVAAVGLVLFFLPLTGMTAYFLSTLAGMLLLCWSIPRLVSMGHPADITDDNETFEQCGQLMDTEDSVNIPFRYQWKHRMNQGWINVVNPFRATLILGNPGSGKSYSVYEPYIEQMIRKGYSMFVYDYKYPSLTQKVYNELLSSTDRPGPDTEFCVIDMNNPAYSLRCNPLNPRYIKDPADASEIAELVMLNVNKAAIEKEDFFTQSAKVILESVIWFLREYQDGRYCTFPHVIEFMSQDYKDVITILLRYPEIRARMRPFSNAMKGNAQEQLQGQLASAQIPLTKFVSRSLYWTLTGDDFSLDINDPQHPKILCVGNDPDRQMIYGTTIALITSRMFKSINHPGRNSCGVLLDEFPTVYLKGIDNLIATARSNKVAVVIGAQDKSQIKRDYGEKESEVIFNTVGNLFAGQVSGKTAQDLSRMFGKELKERHSYTYAVGVDTTSLSSHEEDLIPVRRIETLSQGVFIGKVADNNNMKIDRKLFCGEITRDHQSLSRQRKGWKPIPRMTDFGEESIRRKTMEKGDQAIMERICRIWKQEHVLYDEGYMREKATAECAALSSRERHALLLKEADYQAAMAAERVIQENFDLIQKQVEAIIHAERQRTEPVGRRDQDPRCTDALHGV